MTVSNDGEVYAELSSKKSTRAVGVRRILAQVIATVVTNLHIVSIGLISIFPTILIPALTGFQNDQNRNEFLTMTGSETSWIGKQNEICLELDLWLHIRICR